MENQLEKAMNDAIAAAKAGSLNVEQPDHPMKHVITFVIIFVIILTAAQIFFGFKIVKFFQDWKKRTIKEDPS